MNKSVGGSSGHFAAMIATSTLITYGLMYLNTYQPGHIYYDSVS